MPVKTGRRQCEKHSNDRTDLANRTLLRKSNKTSKKTSSPTPPKHSETNEAALGPTRDIPGEKLKISLNTFVRRLLHSQNMPPRVAEHIADNGWRQSTALVMNTATKRWVQFCKIGRRKPFDFDLNQVLEFLEHLSSELQLSYNAVRDGKQFVMAINKLKKVAMSPADKEVIAKFMKAVFNKKPPIKHRPKIKSWDVDIVLDHIVSQENNAAMELSELAGKLCLLVLLSRMCRIGELALLDLETWKLVKVWSPLHCLYPLKRSPRDLVMIITKVCNASP